jgi:hypothetical protein
VYTLVSASVLALDLTRHANGAAVADVLDRALALDAVAEPVVVDLDRAAARGRLLAVAAGAPRLDEALRAVSRTLGTPDGRAAAQVLSTALVGRLPDLVALLQRELGQERGLAPAVVEAVVDRAVAAWAQADDAAGADDVELLSAPFAAVVGELPAPPPAQGAVRELLVLLEAVARAGASQWAALDAAHAAAHSGLQWSELVHAGSRAAVAGGRSVDVARWQLSAVRAAHSAVRLPGTSTGAAMSLVGAVQALAVADLLPTAVVEPLLAPARSALDLPF